MFLMTSACYNIDSYKNSFSGGIHHGKYQLTHYRNLFLCQISYLYRHGHPGLSLIHISLGGLADGSGAYEEKVVYERRPIAGGTLSPHIWAPEIHYIDGKWYIYYTTTISEESSWRIRPHCLECKDLSLIHI